MAQEMEYRAIIGVEKELKGMDFIFSNSNFFDSNGDWFQNNTRLTVSFPSKSNFKIGVGYQQEFLKLDNHVRSESRPLILLFYQKKWQLFELRDMSTMEFRFIEGEFFKRYRNQLGLQFNKWRSIQPFVLTEAFFSLDNWNYSGQRSTVGLKIPAKQIVFRAFGFYDHTKRVSGNWHDRYAAGVIAIYKFSTERSNGW